jgi:hypothetical protein
MSEDKKETDTITELKNSTFAIQWIIVIIVMVLLTLVINNTFGNTQESFFCFNLSNNKWISSKLILGIFSLISFMVIFITRQITKDKVIPGLTEDQQQETIKDTIPYLVISIAGYVYALSYIKRKFRTSSQMGGGFLGNAVENVERMDYGTVTLYIGIIVLFVNIMSYIFLYLSNKEENRKNKYARSIYFGQISTVLIGLLTSFFVAGFGCESLKTGGFTGISVAIIKWVVLVLVAVFGVLIIKGATDDEDWFGGTKKENENN